MISACNRSENTSLLAMRNTTKKRGADFMSHAKIDDKSGEIFISDHKKSYQTHADVADMSSLGDHSHKTDIPRINSHYARFINVSECIPRKNIIETNEILHRRQDQKYEKLLDSAAIAAESSKALNELLSAKLLEETKKNTTLELKIFNTLKAMKEIQSMAANTAHDLKSPLNTLMLGLESMRTNNETPQSENIKETIDCLESACAFMSSSINRCIDYSKTSVGISLTPSKSSFNLLSSLSNPVKWMRSSLPKDGRLNIILNPIPDNIDKIISDQHWIEENLLCLLSNAIKYSLRGNIRISITLEGSNSGNDKTDNNNCNHRINDISHNDGSILHRTDKQDIDNCEIKTDAKHKCNGCGNSSKIRISVEDDGIGISSVSKSLLFKQFSKLQSNAIGSTGLGLYSLSQRSEAIGGSCGVHDKENSLPGSVFWYEFPYIASIDIKPRKDLSLQYNNDIKEKKLTILIVDDSVTVIKCLNNTLRSHGHNVISAYNGADGLDQMKAHYNDLDIVIMDLQMPIMDGIEATKRFREYENTQNIRFNDDDNDNHHDNRDTQQNYYDVNSTDSFRYGQCDSDNNRNFNNHGHDDNHENNGDHDNENFNVNDNTEIADSDNNTEKKNKRIDRHKIKKRKRLPIICSSANSDREVEFLARSAGMDSFLPKPFHISDLTCILSSFEYAR